MGGFRVGFWDRRAKLYKVEDFKTLINTHTLPGQTEGFKVGCGGMGGQVGGGMGGQRDGWIGRRKEWVDRWEEREGKGGVWVQLSYEAKKKS